MTLARFTILSLKGTYSAVARNRTDCYPAHPSPSTKTANPIRKQPQSVALARSALCLYYLGPKVWNVVTLVGSSSEDPAALSPLNFGQSRPHFLCPYELYPLQQLALLSPKDQINQCIWRPVLTHS